MKVSDSLDNVPNENVVTHLGTDRLTDQLLELLEWLFATKNLSYQPGLSLSPLQPINLDRTRAGTSASDIIHKVSL